MAIKKATTKKTPLKKPAKRITKKEQVKKDKINSYINKTILVLIFLVITFLIYSIFFSTTKDTLVENKVLKTKNTTTYKAVEKPMSHSKFEEKTRELEIEYIHDVPDEAIIENKKSNFIFEENNKVHKKEDNQALKEELIEQLRESLNVEKLITSEPSVFTKEPKVIKLEKEKTTIINKKVQLVEINKEPKETYVYKSTKPLLAILIDDVTTASQVKKIQALPFDITMSFLPPTKGHKNSAKIAQNIKVAMIHLPLEASVRTSEESNTLHIDDSIDTIEKRIRYLKKTYPHIKYINNHTGSKFTSNDKAMNRLSQVLKKHGYYFLDSRTSGKTVAKKYANKYKLPFISRNIFLDNTQEKSYIQNQLKKAIKIAIKKGSAIAIGHPHSITIKTLKESRHLFKNVQLVYIDKLVFR